MKNRVILFICSLTIIFSLCSCQSKETDYNEIYNLDNEIEFNNILTNNEFIEIIDKAKEKELLNTYGCLTWHSLDEVGTTITFMYNYSGELNDYKSSLVHNKINENNIYIKDGHCYAYVDYEKLKINLDDYIITSQEDIKYLNLMMCSVGTIFMMLEKFYNDYDNNDYQINKCGIDNYNNYVLNISFHDDIIRFVINEDYEVIYFTYTEDDRYVYCVYDHQIPTIEFPKLSDYEYIE